MRSADGQLEQYRVQAHERRSQLCRAPHLARRARRQRHRAETARDREALQRPQAARQPERRERVGAERKQRPVGRVLKGPSDERKHCVGRRFGGHVRVGVQTVQHSQPRERQVPEHVLGEQRRSQQQHHVRRHDRGRNPPAREHLPGEQHRRIARAHHERQRLKAARADAEAKAVQGTVQPGGPAALAARHVLGRCAGRTGGHRERARRHPGKSGDSECTQRKW